MKDIDINKRFAKTDEDLKRYVDMKIRAVKKLLAPFIWMRNNPWKTLLGLMILFMLSAVGFHMIDVKRTIEKRLNIELKE